MDFRSGRKQCKLAGSRIPPTKEGENRTLQLELSQVEITEFKMKHFEIFFLVFTLQAVLHEEITKTMKKKRSKL